MSTWGRAVEIILIAIVTAAVILLLTAGCGSITLRPVNPNHRARVTEVTERLGVEQETLNALVAAEQEECDRLDSRVTSWTATAVVVGVLAGGSGLTSVFTDSTPRYVVGGIGVALAAVGALAGFMSTSTAQKYSRRCGVNLGGKGNATK